MQLLQPAYLKNAQVLSGGSGGGERGSGFCCWQRWGGGAEFRESAATLPRLNV